MNFYFDRITFLVIVQSSITFMAWAVRPLRRPPLCGPKISLAAAKTAWVRVCRFVDIATPGARFFFLPLDACFNYPCCSIHHYLIACCVRAGSQAELSPQPCLAQVPTAATRACCTHPCRCRAISRENQKLILKAQPREWFLPKVVLAPCLESFTQTT